MFTTEHTDLEKKFIERERLMLDARNFLDDHADAEGKLTADDTKVFNKMNREIEYLTLNLDKELSRPATATTKPILMNPQAGMADYIGQKTFNSLGVNGGRYKQVFFDQFRSGFRNANNLLEESNNVSGGYLLPTEFYDEIVTALHEENILRKISRNVQTAATQKIIIQSTPPTANFVAEGQSITLSDETFEQKKISAYKLAAASNVTNELLQDSFYDLEGHLVIEFSKAVAAREENAFLNGTGTNEPTGILTTLYGDSSTTITASSANITADDLVNLVYSLKRPYRKNAAFLVNDSTLAAIRKLKDATQNFIWENSLSSGEPPQILGFPVYTSEFMPAIESGKIPVLFGDFSKFIVGQRGEMVFKPLREVHALQDITTFLLIERVDGVLSDVQAIRGLKIG